MRAVASHKPCTDLDDVCIREHVGPGLCCKHPTNNAMELVGLEFRWIIFIFHFWLSCNLQSGPSPASCDHLGGVLEAGFGHRGAGNHAGYFVGAGAVVEGADAGLGAAVVLALLDDKVLVGEGGDLGQMRDAQDLLAAAEGFEFLAYRLRSAATNADIDLVEDQGAGRGSRFPGFGRGLFNSDLEGQHDAAHFAAGGDFMQGLEWLAGVGGDAVLDLIPSCGGPMSGLLRG